LQRTSKTAKKILVVDDNELIADTMATVFRGEGFHVAATYNAQAALRLLQSDSFDLLLSDVMMPGMTGIELAIEVTRRQAIPKVLLMSGVSATTDLLQNARKLGYNFEILTKPIHPTEVIEKIEQLLA